MDTCLQEPHYRNEGGKQGAKEAQLSFFMVDKRVCGTKTSPQKKKEKIQGFIVVVGHLVKNNHPK